jgi:hypothetical protein
MAGGIQKGTEAGSVESKRLDGDIKRVAEAIAQAIEKHNVPNAPFFEKGHKNLVAESFSEEKRQASALPELVEIGISLGCMPDGGMWFDGDRNKADRKLLAVFEAKHQQDGGNAIERWCKNYMLSKAITPDMHYHTLMSGEGAQPGGVLDKFANSMTSANGDGCVFHKSVDGFSEEQIFDIMSTALGVDQHLTYSQVRPFMETKLSRFLDLFEEETLTPEEVLANIMAKQELNCHDDRFVKLVQTPTSPLARVWAQVSSEDKVDAKEIAVEMLQADSKISEIADILRDLFLTK